MSDDDLMRKKEADGSTSLAEAFDNENREPTPMGCSNCGTQLMISPSLSKHYDDTVTVCEHCGARYINAVEIQ